MHLKIKLAFRSKLLPHEQHTFNELFGAIVS